MKRLICAVLCLIASFSLVACSGGEKTDFIEKFDWAALDNYMCAVEDSDFDGDVIAAGTYKIESKGVASDPGDTMIVWDIYVSNNEYTKLTELAENELVATVGGIDHTGGEVTVQPGQYLYIKYNEVYGNPCGFLSFTLQK